MICCLVDHCCIKIDKMHEVPVITYSQKFDLQIVICIKQYITFLRGEDYLTTIPA